MVESMKRSKLKYLDISRNIIEDETLIMFGDLFRDREQTTLVKLDVSSCRISDVGLLYFLEAIESIPELNTVLMKDNFISESSEKLLLELISKNSNLVEFDLKGTEV